MNPQGVVEAIIVGLMTFLAMMAMSSLVIVVVRALWGMFRERDERAPLDDKMYDWKHMGELRRRFENREER